MSDLKKTQHYTTNYERILTGLSDYLDLSVSQLIEPFVGNGDLLAVAPDSQWEKYDLEGKVECIKQDTLLSPPDYTNKTVITNPPFLAKTTPQIKHFLTGMVTTTFTRFFWIPLLDVKMAL